VGTGLTKAILFAAEMETQEIVEAIELPSAKLTGLESDFAMREEEEVEATLDASWAGGHTSPETC